MDSDSDFLPVLDLAKLTKAAPKSIYNQHSTGNGPLAPILVKVGGRLGCWRADYELWRDAQRRLKSPDPAAPTAQETALAVPGRRPRRGSAAAA